MPQLSTALDTHQHIEEDLGSMVHTRGGKHSNCQIGRGGGGEGGLYHSTFHTRFVGEGIAVADLGGF